MGTLLNVAGPVLNLLGVVLLFRYGMPYRVRREGKTPVTLVIPGTGDEEQERLYDRMGWLGLSLIVVGTALQIAATLIESN
jgi:hypothetical protein